METDETDNLSGFPARLQLLIGSDSVSKFAVDVGLGDNLVRKYLHGSTPGADKILSIALAKGANLVWLLTGHGEMYVKGAQLPLAADELSDAARVIREIADNREVEEEFAFVHRYEADGPGVGEVTHRPVDVIAFRKDWLRHRRQPDPNLLAAFEKRGSDMQPTLFEGDLVVFDVSEKSVSVEDIYLFALNDRLDIKRLRNMPTGEIEVISDNGAKYGPYSIDAKTADVARFNVIGRFFWRGGDRL